MSSLKPMLTEEKKMSGMMHFLNEMNELMRCIVCALDHSASNEETDAEDDTSSACQTRHMGHTGDVIT